VVSKAAIIACGLALATPALSDPPTMDALWPNEDGRGWTYTQHYDVSNPTRVLDNLVRLFFDGAAVVPNDIQTQFLGEALVSGPTEPTTFDLSITDPFLRQLWVARPDLHTKIHQMVTGLACPLNRTPGSQTVLLGGQLYYRKTPDEVVAMRCDLANTRAWQWLVSDLTPGNAFTLQLLPDLTTDLFLHGTIAAIEPVTVTAGTLENCVRVDYVVDYGASACVDMSGNTVGTFRSETRGHVHYAPTIGPVESYEEFVPIAEQLTGDCGQPVGEVASHASLQMLSLPTPVRQTTWGRLKLMYR